MTFLSRITSLISCAILIAFLFKACTLKEGNPDLVKTDRERIITAADACLTEGVLTVTAFPCERSAGGIHDYYSEGDYWWPDPENPQGPYIRKDGLTNPDNFTAHRRAMRNMSIWVPTLAAAFRITGEEKYAKAAVKHLQAWFSDPQTRMNPSLMYAQAIMGRVSGRGIGIIDTLHLTEVAKAVETLEALGYLSGDFLDNIKSWFKDYLEWMFTHDYGIAERDNGNNHSTCWAVQVAAFASLLDDREKLDFCRNFYKSTLLPGQMAVDGSFPKELGRTKPYAYSLFNLEAMTMLVQILTSPKHNLWDFALSDGRSIGLGISFMYPYMLDKSGWFKEPDVMYYEQWPVRHTFLLFGGLSLNKPAYIDLWRTLDADPQMEEVIRNFPFRQPILWLD